MRLTDILRRLNEHLSHPVIYADQIGKKPPYPYIAIKEIVSFIPAANHPSITDDALPEDIKRTATSQPKISLSITAYGVTLNDSAELIQQAHDWFAFSGTRTLKESGYIVAELQSIMNRDSLIVDDYERRRGFDVSLRFVHKQSKVVEEIKVVKGRITQGNF